MRRVLTRDKLNRLLRARWLFAAVVLLLVVGSLVVTGGQQVALAADTRGATEAVSVDNNGTLHSGGSFAPAISANGRFVAFATSAGLDSLDRSNDTSGHTEDDIYVRDTLAGHPSTTYLSRGHGDGLDEAATGPSDSPSMSASGRYVGFVSSASDIVNSTSATAVICDRGTPDPTGGFGTSCQYTLLGTSTDSAPKLSADGSRVVYLHNNQAVLVKLTINPTTGVITGAASFSSPPRPDPLTVAGNSLRPSFDDDLALSADGRWLVRVTEYHDTSGHFATVLLLNDLNADPAGPAATARFDYAGTTANSFVGDANFLGDPAVSGNGRRIAFTEFPDSGGSVLHLIDRGPSADNGSVPPTSQPVSAGLESLDTNGQTATGAQPAFSTDGRYLAYVTDSAHVHNGVDDTSQFGSCIHITIGAFHRPLGDDPDMKLAADTGISHCDVVVRDLVQDAARAAAHLPMLPAELASPSQQSTLPGVTPPVTCDPECEGNGESDEPVLDEHGDAVAYSSGASNLLANNADQNNSADVFKRTFKPVPVVASVNFGDVVVNTSKTGTATVAYSGFGPLKIGAITIDGTNAGDFTVLPNTCTAAVLYPESSCEVSIRFTPPQLNGRSATLTVNTDTGVHGTGRLTGNGVPEPPPRTPVFQAAPDPLDFGTQPLFQLGGPKTVTVTNTGTAPLTITNVTLVGSAPTNFPGDYTIGTNTCVGTPVVPGGTCTVSVSFAPQAVGGRPALLQFTDNATPGPQLVGLTGAGAPPTLVASPPLAPPGAVSQVTGTGFPPGKVVALTLDLMPGPVLVTASSTGTFTAPLVIFPHTSLGRRQLHATVQGVTTPIVVSIDYLVVPGSLQPPDFAQRR